MNAILYTTIFIIGTLFGSFYTLAVYRIPRKKDITHTHSFCPNCNHKLGFFELIPVLSYIFLGGKCKNCKQKIRPRYLILEILSGLSFLIFAYIFRLDAYKLNFQIIIKFAFFTLYLCAIFIIAGISKENKKIEKSVLYYSVAVSLIYIIYLCIINTVSIYRYAMYLITLVILFIVDLILLKKKAKDSSIIEALILITVMFIFTGEYVTLITIISVCIWQFILVAKKYMVNHFRKGKKEIIKIEEIFNIPFYISIFNVICALIIGIMVNYVF